MIKKEYNTKEDHIIWEVPTEELAQKCDKWIELNTSSENTWDEWDKLDEELKQYKTFDKFD